MPRSHWTTTCRAAVAAPKLPRSRPTSAVSCLRMLLHSPKDMIAGLLAAAAVSAVIANALFLQAGRHPSPMFGGSRRRPQPIANPLPRPRPVEASRSIEPPAAETARRPRPRVSNPDPPMRLTSLVAKTTAPVTCRRPQRLRLPHRPSPSCARRPPVPVATPHAAAGRRIAAVQRTLTEYGYGQL